MWRRGIILALAALILGAAGACGGGDAFGPTPAPASPADAMLSAAPTQAPTPPPLQQVAPTQAPPSQEPRGGGNLQAAPLPQSRIVVHNASMVLVVDDVARTVDRIAGVARGLGGWVVNSDRSSRHSGTIPTFPIWLKSFLSNSSMVFQPSSNYGPFGVVPAIITP